MPIRQTLNRLSSNLRLRLLALVIIGALPAVAFFLYDNYEMNRLSNQELQQDAINMVDASSRGLTDFLDATHQLVQTLTEVPEIATADPDTCNNFLRSYSGISSVYNNIAVFNTDGGVICASTPVTPTINVKDRAWFQRVFQVKDFVISEYQIGRISGMPTIIFAHPVLNSRRRVTRIVGVSIHVEEFAGRIVGGNLPALTNGTIMVLDKNGTIISATTPNLGFIGRSLVELAPDLGRAVLTGKESTIETTGPGGSLRFFAYNHINVGSRPVLYITVGFQRGALVGVSAGLSRLILTRSLIGILILIGFLFLIALFGGDALILRKVRRSVETEALIESIGDGVIFANRKGNTLMINPAAREMIGARAMRLVGRPINECPLEADDERGNRVPEIKCPIELVLASGKKVSNSGTGSFSYYIVREGNIKIPIAVTASPVYLYGRLIGAVEIFRDISKEKELDKNKNEFIYLVSHQLRTPVSALSWIVESLQVSLKGMDEKQKLYFHDIDESVRRLVRLVEDLLVVSRAWLGVLAASKEKVDLGLFIKESIKMMESYAASKNHKIKFEVKELPCIMIEVDSKLLYNAFQNLVTNAIEYSPEGTAVRVELRGIEDAAEIAIYNKGPAIPKEEQAHLFEKFYRGESIKKIKPEGTGLGLFIVKSLVEKIGGKVGFKSEEGGETVFWIILPCTKEMPCIANNNESNAKSR